MPRKHGPIRTDLYRDVWVLPEGETVKVVPASKRRCGAVDDEWPRLRPPRHQNLGWKWEEVYEWCKETFAIVAEDGTTLAMWASKKRVDCREGLYYRLDYVEVHPQWRGTDLAPLTFGLAAMRALELGCVGIVLPSFPETAHIYQEMGAESRLVSGWKVEEGMVPFVIPLELLKEAAEEADEYRKK